MENWLEGNHKQVNVHWVTFVYSKNSFCFGIFVLNEILHTVKLFITIFFIILVFGKKSKTVWLMCSFIVSGQQRRSTSSTNEPIKAADQTDTLVVMNLWWINENMIINNRRYHKNIVQQVKGCKYFLKQ